MKINENEFKNFLNTLSNGIIILNLNKKIIFTNTSIKEFFKGKKNNFLGNYLDCNDNILKDTICQNKQNCEICFIGKAFDLALITKKEQIIKNIKFQVNNYEIDVTCKVNFNPNLQCVVLEFLNLSEEKEYFNFFVKTFDELRDIIFFKNKKHQYIYINKAGVEFFGNQDILYKTDYELMPKAMADDCIQGDIDAIKFGKLNKIEHMGNKIFRTSKEYINGGILGLAQDITDEYNAQLSANLDTLTGLYNRRKFNQLMDKIFQEKKREYYLAIIDLDNLRIVNNDYGHLKGDEYLHQLSSILSEEPDCTFFRFGGDEFVGLLPNNKTLNKEIFDRIYAKLLNLNLIPPLSISTGIKKLNLNKNIFENFEEVDNILYTIKNNNKGTYKIT